MRAERGHPPPSGGDAPCRVERAELAPAAPRRRRARRPAADRGTPDRAGGVPQAAQSSTRPDSSASRISGRSNARQTAMQRGRPEPDRDTRRLAAGAAGSLLRGGARDAHRGQPGQAGGRIEPRRPPPAAIDHDPHARHGQRGLGDRGRQHHAPSLGRPQRAILLGRRQIAVQRQHQRAAALQRRLGAADLRHAGQESQDVAVMLRQRRSHRAGHRIGQIARTGNVARGVADRRPGTCGRRFRSPRASISPARRAPSAVADIASSRSSGRSTRCRSRHSASARSDSSERSCTSSRITAATPSSPGSDCSRRTSRPSVITSMRVAAIPRHRAGCGSRPCRPTASPQQGRHARRRGPRGQPARFQHQDPAVAAPRCIEQRQRHQCRLAGARRRHQHGIAPGGEGGQQGRDEPR